MSSIRYDRFHQIANARILAVWRSYYAAALYLRNLGWSLEAARWILLRK